MTLESYWWGFSDCSIW